MAADVLPLGAEEDAGGVDAGSVVPPAFAFVLVVVVIFTFVLVPLVSLPEKTPISVLVAISAAVLVELGAALSGVPVAELVAS